MVTSRGTKGRTPRPRRCLGHGARRSEACQASVFRGSLSVVNHENFTWAFFLFQFEPELLLQGSDEIRRGIDGLGEGVSPGLSKSIRRPLQLEIVEALETGLVQHRAA